MLHKGAQTGDSRSPSAALGGPMSLPREPLWGSTGGNGHTSPSVALTRQTAPCGCSQGIAKPGIQQSGISPSPSISQQPQLPVPCPASPAFPRCRGTLLYTLVNTSRANTLSHQPSSHSPGMAPPCPGAAQGWHSPTAPPPRAGTHPGHAAEPESITIHAWTLSSCPSLGPLHSVFPHPQPAQAVFACRSCVPVPKHSEGGTQETPRHSL